ncbi:MAG: polysaccharide deacetylase family protein [Candidatus Hydrogenedentota bacterium]
MKERSLIEDVKHARGRYGGFCFGGAMPEGASIAEPLPAGAVFPNGAHAALLLTFDVEGTYGNGAGDMQREIVNYYRICEHLARHSIPATFNVVGQMAEEQGPEFIEAMWDAGCEVAPHGYVHDMNKRYGGDAVYAGHYGPEENRAQVRDGIAAIEAVRPGVVKGFRLPYGHFNEYTYNALEEAGLLWASNVGIDDFVVPGQGFGAAPFRMQLGDKVYRMVEIPLDSQTYDWCIWIADEEANATFVNSVRAYCTSRGISFERTPHGGVAVWDRRMRDAIESERMFTLLCHPINLAVFREEWGDPLEEFLLPVIDRLAQYHREGEAWVCTCAQLAEFYLEESGKRRK